MNKHCENMKAAIAIAEAGDSKMAAYRVAAEEAEKAIDEDGLTQREVAAQSGCHQTTVKRLLDALMRTRITNSDFYVDWGSGSNRRADIAVTVPKSHAAQVKMAAELLAKPDVAEAIVRSHTPAASTVQQAVSRKNAEDRDAFMRMAEQQRQRQALPISGHHARIIGKLQFWAAEIVAIEPDLVESRDAFLAHGISVALRDLATQCIRIADRIDQDTDIGVIESSAHRDT